MASAWKRPLPMMLKGMTAEYLLNRTLQGRALRPCCCFMPQPAASASSPASGRRRSVRPLSARQDPPDKVQLALEHGYDHVINYKTENFAERVREITSGKGRGRGL